MMLTKEEARRRAGRCCTAHLSPFGLLPPSTHKHWVTSLPLPAPRGPTFLLPKFCPTACWNQGPVNRTESSEMYLWTRLFHEALFEVVPGDEGHELGEERHTVTPRLTCQGFKAPQQRGSLEWGRMCAHDSQGYIWNVGCMQY